MEKTFTIGSTEYTVKDCTAICKSIGESERRKALYIYNISESGEKTEFVVFGYDMPEDESEFIEMCEDSSAWDGWCETVESIRIHGNHRVTLRNIMIKETRKKYKLTQKQLSEITGIPMRSIQNWETGKRRCPEYTYKLIEYYVRKKIKESEAGT